MRLTLWFLIATCPVYAQAPSGSVVGRVTDASGAIVPGVSLTVTSLTTNQARKALTSSAGDYSIPYLAPGRYVLEATATGFTTHKQAAFDIDLDQEQRIDIRMEVGSAGQSITVSETPEALNTENGSKGEVTSNAEITEMPLNGRNYADLAYLTPGVVNKSDNTDGQFSVNGARADNVGFLIDGMNNTQRRNTSVMVTPPLEGVQEFKVITSGFAAEYGHYAGGVVSMVTRSGGNQLRGSLYEFLRNDALDARNFFDTTKSKLIQNQFGATVTGPVRVPKIYNGKDKTFFLVSWESLISVAGETARGVVPQTAMLQGDFSKAVTAFGKPEIIIDPLAKKAPFEGNVIPVSRLDPVARAIAAYYPKPNVSGNVNNYIAQGNSSTNGPKLNLKVDHSLGAQDRLTFSAIWNGNTVNQPFIINRSPVLPFGTTNNTFGLLSGIHYIHIFSPTLFDEASVNFSRSTLNQLPKGSDHDWSTQAGFLGATKNPIDLGLPYMTVSGYVDLGQPYDLPKTWSYNNFEYSDTVTWIRDRHTVKFGGNLLHYQYFNHDYSDLRGRLNFLGRFTNDPLADLVLGYAATSRRLTQVGSEYHLASNYSGFVQDNFKATSRLTFNLGLRYELSKQPIEKYNSLGVFIPSLGKLVLAGNGLLSTADYNSAIQSTGLSQYITTASAVGLPRGIVKTNYSDFAPRFGFAWRPFGDKTVIRGGYGIFYGTDSLYRYSVFSNTFPYANTQTFSAVTTNPLALTVSNPFPAAIAKSSGVVNTNGMNESSPSQNLQSWNLALERDLGRGTVLEISYAGSKGTHLPIRYNLNQQPLIPGVGLGTRAYSAFSTITIIDNTSNSIYNSGTLTVRRRLHQQLFVRAAYVYAKSLDQASNTAGVAQGQDPFNLSAERGRSDFDVGHSFLASFIWSPRFSRLFAFRDWQVNGTTTAYTGLPLTPVVANYSITTGGAARPDRIGSGKLENPTPDQWFDRNAFPVVPPGGFRYGDSGRGIIDGPGSFVMNVGLSRRFRLRERTFLQFRTEAFNVTNRANFGLPNAQVDIVSGGSITTAKHPRQLQFALRLEF
jgi:outer membrane receptor protein involved in Fe transport